jgi:hypothetical protein
MGLYTITTRADGTVLTGFGASAGIFNDDHVNHVTHTEPMSINSHEQTQAQMDLEADPVPGGIPSLAKSCGEELERIRFVVSQMKTALQSGVPPAHWYVPLTGVSGFPAFPPVACRREASVGQHIPDSITARLVWDNEIYDTTGTMHPTDFAITIPIAGVYKVGALVTLPASTALGGTNTNDFQLSLAGEFLLPNNTVAVLPIATDQYRTGILAATTPIPQRSLTVEAVIRMEIGRQLTTRVFQSRGDFAVLLASPNLRSSFWASFVSF